MAFKDDIENELIAIIERAMPSVKQRIVLPKVSLKEQEARIRDFLGVVRLIVLYQMFDREAAEREFLQRLKYRDGGL